MSAFEVYRHLYTSAPDGSLGRPGFQTVAAADPLVPVVAELEEIVGGFRGAPASGSPADRRPARQVVQMYDEGYYALTTTTPLERGPDERGGNFWAESFVVPADWLAAGAWDLAAAFQALSWWGPRQLDRSGTPAGSPVSLGAGEEIPPLAPGSLERLDALRDALPEPLLEPLLLAVAQLTQARQPVAVVEGAGDGLDHLLPLLPLVLPPAARRFQAGEHRRTFTLRTWGTAGAGPEVDLVALPSAELESAATSGARLIDLSGQRRPARPREPIGTEFARWAAEVVARGDWDGLARCHELAAGAPSARAFLEGFPEHRGTLEAGAAGGAAPGPTISSRRREAWLTREALDELLARERERLAAERAEVAERLRAEASERMAQLRDDLFQELRDEEETLEREIAQARADVARVLEEGRRDLQALQADLADLRDAAEEALATAHRERQLLAADLGTAAQGSGTRGERAGRRPRGAPADIPRDERGATRTTTTTGRAAASAPEPGLLAALVGLPLWARLTAAALVVVLLLGAGYLWLRPRGDEQTAETDGTTTTDPAGDQPTEQALAIRLGDPALAAALLGRAVEVSGLGETAATLFLDLHLDGGAPVEPSTRDALIQSALGAGVDGAFGPGSAAALDRALVGEAACCAELTGEERRLCYLAWQVDLEEPAPCTGGDPFDAGAVWDDDSAARLLRQVRTASSSAGTEDLKTRLDRLDLTKSPGHLEGLPADLDDDPVASDEAARLLRLARAVATGAAVDTLSARPPAAELQEVARLLDGLAGSAGAASSGGSEAAAIQESPP